MKELLMFLMLVIVTLSPTARADDIRCVGFLTGIIHGNVIVPAGLECRLSEATVRGNVLVEPAASLAVLADTTIYGNLEANSPASLLLDNDPGLIRGNVKAFRALRVEFMKARVHGDVELLETRGVGILIFPQTGFLEVDGNFKIEKTEAGEIVLESARVRQNVYLRENSVGSLGFVSSEIRGNLIIEKNSGAGTLGGVFIAQNVIGQNLQVIDNRALVTIDFNTVGENLDCSGNEPDPVATGNTARQSTGECRLGLVPPGPI